MLREKKADTQEYYLCKVQKLSVKIHVVTAQRNHYFGGRVMNGGECKRAF
jgi:hypothetical protein